MIKLFQDVQAGDKVYTIDPRKREILEMEVRNAEIHPKSTSGNVMVIEAYTALDKHGVGDEQMKTAKDEGVENTTQKFLLPKDAKLVILQTKVPTVLCADKQYLEKWMNKKKRN